MNLEKVTAVIRPRAPWESVDMGFRMVLSRGALIYSTMALVMLPVTAIVIGATLLTDMVGLSLVILWWFKPAFDRIVLHILSHSLFSDPPGVRSTLRQAPQLALGAGITQALTIYRFDPARSLNLPVWQLEKLRGAGRWRRARILHRDTWGVATMLTLFCASLEAVFILSVYLIIGLLIPPELHIGVADWMEYLFYGQGSTLFNVAHTAIYATVVCLVEPLFVGGGFALYLNRRTILEAWDIELAFRRIAGRHRKFSAAAAMLIGIGFTMALLAPDRAHAEAAAPDPAELIQEVLRDEAFQTHESLSGWQPHYPDQEESRDSGWHPPEWFAHLVARSGEFVIWAAVFALAAFLWLRRALLKSFFQPPAKRAPPPPGARAMQEPMPAPNALPDDIPSAVQQLMKEQRFTDAASLLYRGALNEVDTRHALGLDSSATEGDWLREVQRHSPAALARLFQSVTRAWQYTAYAHQPPPGDDLLTLCRQWPHHFGPQS